MQGWSWFNNVIHSRRSNVEGTGSTTLLHLTTDKVLRGLGGSMFIPELTSDTSPCDFEQLKVMGQKQLHSIAIAAICSANCKIWTPGLPPIRVNSLQTGCSMNGRRKSAHTAPRLLAWARTMQELMQRGAQQMPAQVMSPASLLHLQSRLHCSPNGSFARSAGSLRSSTCLQAARSEAPASRPRGFGTPQTTDPSAPSRPRGFDSSSSKTFDPKYFNNDTPWDVESEQDTSTEPLRGFSTPGTRKLTVRKGAAVRSGGNARPAPSKPAPTSTLPLAAPAAPTGRSRQFGQLLRGLSADMMGVPGSVPLPPKAAPHAPATLAGRRKRTVQTDDSDSDVQPAEDESNGSSSGHSTPLQQAYSNQRSASQAAAAASSEWSNVQGSSSYESQQPRSEDRDYADNSWGRDAPRRNSYNNTQSRNSTTRVPYGHEESEWAPQRQQRQQPRQWQAQSSSGFSNPRDDRPSKFTLFNLPEGDEWKGEGLKRGNSWCKGGHYSVLTGLESWFNVSLAYL